MADYTATSRLYSSQVTRFVLSRATQIPGAVDERLGSETLSVLVPSWNIINRVLMYPDFLCIIRTYMISIDINKVGAHSRSPQLV